MKVALTLKANASVPKVAPVFKTMFKTKTPKISKKTHVEFTEEEIWKKTVNKQILKVGRDTISMWRCAFFGRMPPPHSINSFGITSLIHVKAIQWCISNMRIVPEQLDAAKKSGLNLTKMVDIEGQPFSIKFITIWDIESMEDA